MEVGASGYVLENSPAQQLLAAIRDLYRGGSYLSPRMLSQLVDDFRSRIKSAHRQPRFATLTTREKEILKFLAEGESVKEIAAGLNMSAKTVKAHKFSLMRSSTSTTRLTWCSTPYRRRSRSRWGRRSECERFWRVGIL